MDFIDLAAQQKRIRPELEARMKAVLDHGKYILGPEIDELEKKLAAYVGVKHAISCSNGTDALVMPLMAKDIGPGDVVFVPAFTFFATAEVVSARGATPMFVDITQDTFNIDVGALESSIRAVVEQKCPRFRGLKAKAIIPVDLFGQPADYREIQKLADKYGLMVLEDLAQGFGATYQGKRTGSFGHVAATSFFPAKPLGCYGDGGAMFTNDDEMATRLKSVRVHGQGKDKYENVRIGINGRLDTMQAAILLSKLSIFDDEIKLRDRVAARYNEALKPYFIVPEVKPDRTSVWAQYTLITDKRDAFAAKMKEAGIPTVVYYPKPLHLQTAFASLAYRKGDMPVSERLSEQVISLPMHPYLSEQDQDRITAAAIKAARELSIERLAA